MRKWNQEKRKQFHRRIFRWYDRHKRNLLWRGTRNPYKICLSEIMLHQTQANRVNERFPEFLRLYPTIRSLARASKADVVRAWRGLGYNRRAIHLWYLACIIIDKYGGQMPNDIHTLEKLPAIGKYTARAIGCFAFDQRLPIVDVNVRRVLSRVFWKAKHPLDYRSMDEIWSVAEQFLPKRAFYNWNQALMDLGAAVCIARRPLCNQCPITNLCSSSHLHRSSQQNKIDRRIQPEPSHDGILQRHWRGRVIEALRNLTNGRMISLDRLGPIIKPDFRKSELPWLVKIVERLERDSLVSCRRARKKIHVRLAHE
jgi:A/G-specific adenine glycosylase